MFCHIDIVMLLKIKSLLIKRGKKTLIRNFNLTITKSQITIVSGDNGVGKSTLLETIAGLQKNFEGKITFFSQNKMPVLPQSRNIFFLGHLNALKDELSVLENLKIWTNVNLLKIKDIQLLENLSYFDLYNFSNIKLNKLSFGQRRKVALTKLLITDSNFWILDEPCNGLDEVSEKKFLDLVQKRKKKGGCIIFTSHKRYKNKEFKSIDLNCSKSAKKSNINSDLWSNL